MNNHFPSTRQATVLESVWHQGQPLGGNHNSLVQRDSGNRVVLLDVINDLDQGDNSLRSP